MNYLEFLSHFPDYCIQLFDDAGVDKSKAKTIAGSKANWDNIKQANTDGTGVFFSINRFPSGVRRVEYCQGINAWFAESDQLPIEEQKKNLEILKLKPSFIVRSKKSLHAYWLAKDGTMENFKLIQEWLKRKLTGDNAMKDYSRVLRIPEFYHMKDRDNPFKVEIVSEHPELIYSEDEMVKEFVDLEQLEREEEEQLKKIKEIESRFKAEGDDIYTAINLIPIEAIVAKEMNWRWDGKKHWYAPDSRAPSACFKAKDGNYVVHGGTHHFSDEQAGYSPFGFIKMRHSFNDRDTFDWFKNEFPEIAELDKKNKQEFIAKQNTAQPSEVKAENWEDISALWGELLAARKNWLKEIGKEKTAKPIDKEMLYSLALWIMQAFNTKNIGERTAELKVYQDGIYTDAEPFLRLGVTRVMGQNFSRNYIDEVLAQIKNLSVYPRKNFDDLPAQLINLKNGVFNLEDKKLIKHSPEYTFVSRLPVIYDPKADCPQFKKFVGEILGDSLLPLITEWFGFCIYRDYFIKKALVLVGPRDTGKTTLLNVLIAFIGPENIAGVELSRFGQDRFATVPLFNKFINLVDDLSFKDVTSTGTFKMLTGKSNISGEYKFGNRFNFVNYAKLTFATNKIPKVREIDDEAYFSRWIVLKFEKKILTPDTFLGQRLTTENELSGILNLALSGLERLLTTQSFSYHQEVEEVKKEMLRSDSVAGYLEECLEEVPNNFTSIDNLYKKYHEYCQACNLTLESKDSLSKAIRQFIPYARAGEKNDAIVGHQRGYYNLMAK